MVATSMLEHIFEGINGDSVYRGASFLAGKLGQQIAGSNITVIDDGTIVGGFGTSPFDGEGVPQPWDGVASGELLVKGPWVIGSYFGATQSPLQDGWFPTGDVATIDADGFMQITDRSKDVIKSGGEWISSIALESLAVAHPAVHQAAAISVAHPQWGERPLLIVVLKPGATATREELLAFYQGKTPNWQVPNDVIFLPELPHTATGKIQKLKLREAFRNHQWSQP